MEKITYQGERLLAVRRAAGISLTDMALRLGIGAATLHRWEHEELPKVRYFAVLRAIGKAYRERAGRYRQEDAAARKVS